MQWKSTIYSQPKLQIPNANESSMLESCYARCLVTRYVGVLVFVQLKSGMMSGARSGLSLINHNQKVDQGMVLVVGESAARVPSCSCVDLGSRIASVRVFNRISAKDELAMTKRKKTTQLTSINNQSRPGSVCQSINLTTSIILILGIRLNIRIKRLLCITPRARNPFPLGRKQPRATRLARHGIIEHEPVLGHVDSHVIRVLATSVHSTCECVEIG